MNTSTNLHIDDDDEIAHYRQERRITLAVGSGPTCAWLHLSLDAAVHLYDALIDALEAAPASPVPTGVEVDGAPAGTPLPAGATAPTKEKP